MDDNQRLHLQKMITANNVEDNTDLRQQTISLSSKNKDLEEVIKDLKRQLAILK